MGIRGKVSRSTLADANERHDERFYADLAQALIRIARPLYAEEDLGLDLDNTVYALEASTIDLCLSVFPWALFRSTQSAVQLHTLLDLRGNIPTFLHIARWDESAWSALGAGISGGNGNGGPTTVSALAVHPTTGDLYAGGWFTTTGGKPSAHIGEYARHGAIALDFGTRGLWQYDGAWSLLTGWNAGSAGLTDWSGGLAVDFDGQGLWNRAGPTWTRLATWDPGTTLAGWIGGLAVDFDDQGLWNRAGSTWTRLTTW